MHGLDVSALLASGYASFLAVVAAGLELVARHSHRRTQRIRTAGFSYHPALDLWKCPNGQHLYRAEVAPDAAVVRYRAQAHQCNSCPIKYRCTDSEQGRVIEVRAGSWLQSELRKFQRGLSLTLLLLADVILLVTILRQNSLPDRMLLVLPLFAITAAGLRLWSGLFPEAERNVRIPSLDA